MDEPSLRAPEPHGQRFILPFLIAICLVIAVVFFYVPRSMADPDIWWHLRDAQLQVSSHSFLTHDLFSFTAAGSSWMNHEWLAAVPFSAALLLFCPYRHQWHLHHYFIDDRSHFHRAVLSHLFAIGIYRCGLHCHNTRNMPLHRG